MNGAVRVPVRVLNVTPKLYRSVGAEQVARDIAASLTAAGADVRPIESTVDASVLPPDVDVVIGYGDADAAPAQRLVEQHYPAGIRVQVLHGIAAPGPLAGASLVVAVGPHITSEASRVVAEVAPDVPAPVHTLIPDLPALQVPPAESGAVLRLLVTVAADDGLDRPEFAATITARLRARGIDAGLLVVCPLAYATSLSTRLHRIAGDAVRTTIGRVNLTGIDAVIVPSVRDSWHPVAALAARSGVPVVVSQGSGLGAVLADPALVPAVLGAAAAVPDGVDPGVLRLAGRDAAGVADALGATDELRIDAWTDRVSEIAADRAGHRARARALRAHLAQQFPAGQAGAGLLAALGLSRPVGKPSPAPADRSTPRYEANTAGTRRPAPDADEGPPLARTPHEAHLYLDLRPCDCGETRFNRASVVVPLADGGLGRRYAALCPGCGRHREFLFRLPDEPLEERAGEFRYGGPEPSRLLDPGEWLLAADRLSADRPADLAALPDDERRRARDRLAAAAAAVEEALKFAPAGADEIPGGALCSRLGLGLYARDPDRFRVEVLTELRDGYRAAAFGVPPDEPPPEPEAPITGGVVGYRWAFQRRPARSPMLRVRYRAGVPVNPYGFPHWYPYARLVVGLPPADPALGIDEARVVDVLAANLVASRTGDPFWAEPGATPAGWTWAHQGMTRELALVPAELHSAFRHQGGVSTAGVDLHRRGLRTDGAAGPPRIAVEERLADEAVTAVEERLAYRLPDAYRHFLRNTNGGRPGQPAVHPRAGFVADQRLFGLNRPDWLQDLVYANGFFGDRLTADYLALGYVQGGLLALRVRGGDEGSVWWYDDDDPRDRDEYGAAEVCDRLLVRLADDFAAFWLALRPAPGNLASGAAALATNPATAIVAPDDLGSALPRAHRRET